MQGQRAQLNLQEPVKSAVYEFTGGAGVKFCGNETDGRATAVWEALEKMHRVSERRVKRIAELPCRLRGLESFILGREKMAALGTLAAGLAHELNNPAAALV